MIPRASCSGVMLTATVVDRRRVEPAHCRFELGAEAVGRRRAPRDLGGIVWHGVRGDVRLGRARVSQAAEHQTAHRPCHTPEHTAPGQTHGTRSSPPVESTALVGS